MSYLRYLQDTLGFDETTHEAFTKYYHIACSQCAALAINGVPCHERGCPHQRRDDEDDDIGLIPSPVMPRRQA